MRESSPRILLVDPNSTERDTLRRRLEAGGYFVQTAATGPEAMLICELAPPDVLILDTCLPDMDGFDVCARIRHGLCDADPAVILIADVEDEMMRSYLGQMVDFAGADFFLAKPCDARLLVKLLDDLARESDPRCPHAPPVFPTRTVWPTGRTGSVAVLG